MGKTQRTLQDMNLLYPYYSHAFCCLYFSSLHIDSKLLVCRPQLHPQCFTFHGSKIDACRGLYMQTLNSKLVVEPGSTNFSMHMINVAEFQFSTFTMKASFASICTSLHPYL